MKTQHKALDNTKHTRYNLTNGACAVVNADNKLVAYHREGSPTNGEWDWVRADYQQFSKKT